MLENNCSIDEFTAKLSHKINYLFFNEWMSLFTVYATLHYFCYILWWCHCVVTENIHTPLPLISEGLGGVPMKNFSRGLGNSRKNHK